MKVTIDVNNKTSVTWRGSHRDVRYEIFQHGFVPDEIRATLSEIYPSIWCTYVVLTEEQHEKFKDRINDAPWNGGQTYYRKHSVEYIDVSPELKRKWDGHYYKIGDDFAHLWDMDQNELFSKSFMENHIKCVIDFLLSGAGVGADE